MNESDEVLIQILAATDAVFVPLRRWAGCAASNIYIARRDYAARGVPWHSETPNPTEQRRRQRAIHGLADDGLIITHRPAVKTLSVGLTDTGEARARALCGLPDLCVSLVTMRRIARMSKRPPKLLTHKWISEYRLIGKVAKGSWGKHAAAVEEQCLPVLLRGLVESNADADGRVSYCITSAGWKALDDGIEAPAGEQVAVDPGAIQLWLESMESARAKLETGPATERREVGEVPLPVHVEGLELLPARNSV